MGKRAIREAQEKEERELAAIKLTGEDVVEKGILVKKSIVSRAIRAILQVIAKRTANANPLFGAHSEMMTVVFAMSQVPQKYFYSKGCVIIPLPHPMYDDKSEICFISKPPQKKYKELLLKTKPVPGVTKVLGYEKIRRKYNTLEAKKALADSFDLFICDRLIASRVPGALGVVFTKKRKKTPLVMKLNEEDPRPAFEKIMKGTPFKMPTGPCVGVKIGRASMPADDLLENAITVINHVVKITSRAGNPVISISVHATETPALPIWRRPRPEGELLDLKKYRSDAASSAASDTGLSGASETEGASDRASDTLETLSTKDTISEVGTGVETLSEVEAVGDTISELDSEAGDVSEDRPLRKHDLPLVKGLKKNKKKRAGALEAEAAAPAPAAAPAQRSAQGTMPPPTAPPKKKAKKGKGKEEP